MEPERIQHQCNKHVHILQLIHYVIVSVCLHFHIKQWLYAGYVHCHLPQMVFEYTVLYNLYRFTIRGTCLLLSWNILGGHISINMGTHIHKYGDTDYVSVFTRERAYYILHITRQWSYYTTIILLFTKCKLYVCIARSE